MKTEDPIERLAAYDLRWWEAGPQLAFPMFFGILISITLRLHLPEWIGATALIGPSLIYSFVLPRGRAFFGKGQWTDTMFGLWCGVFGANALLDTGPRRHPVEFGVWCIVAAFIWILFPIDCYRMHRDRLRDREIARETLGVVSWERFDQRRRERSDG